MTLVFLNYDSILFIVSQLDRGRKWSAEWPVNTDACYTEGEINSHVWWEFIEQGRGTFFTQLEGILLNNCWLSPFGIFLEMLPLTLSWASSRIWNSVFPTLIFRKNKTKIEYSDLSRFRCSPIFPLITTRPSYDWQISCMIDEEDVIYCHRQFPFGFLVKLPYEPNFIRKITSSG